MNYLKLIPLVLCTLLIAGCSGEKQYEEPYYESLVETVGDYRFTLLPEDYNDGVASPNAYNYQYHIEGVYRETAYTVGDIAHQEVYDIHVYVNGCKLTGHDEGEGWTGIWNSLAGDATYVEFHFPDNSPRDIEIEIIRTTHKYSFDDY